jgi:hypothetical protein
MKLRAYIAVDGQRRLISSRGGESAGALAGTLIVRTSSVVAMAKTPSPEEDRAFQRCIRLGAPLVLFRHGRVASRS